MVNNMNNNILNVQFVKDYIEFLKENKEYTTKFYDIGDGLSLSFKNEDK